MLLAVQATPLTSFSSGIAAEELSKTLRNCPVCSFGENGKGKEAPRPGWVEQPGQGKAPARGRGWNEVGFKVQPKPAWDSVHHSLPPALFLKSYFNLFRTFIQNNKKQKKTKPNFCFRNSFAFPYSISKCNNGGAFKYKYKYEYFNININFIITAHF